MLRGECCPTETVQTVTVPGLMHGHLLPTTTAIEVIVPNTLLPNSLSRTHTHTHTHTRTHACTHIYISSYTLYKRPLRQIHWVQSVECWNVVKKAVTGLNLIRAHFFGKVEDGVESYWIKLCLQVNFHEVSLSGQDIVGLLEQTGVVFYTFVLSSWWNVKHQVLTNPSSDKDERRLSGRATGRIFTGTSAG